MWRNKAKQGIRIKLMIPGAVALLVVLAIVEWWFVPLNVADRREHLEHDQKAMLAVVSSTLQEDVLSGNLGHIYSVLDNAVAVNKSWNGVMLTDESGVLLYPARKPSNTLISNEMLTQPILFAGKLIGRITLYYDTRTELQAEKAQIHDIAIWVLAIIFTALIANYIWQDTVLRRPVKKLVAMAKLLSGGDFSKAVTVSGNDEIGQLGSAMEFLRVNLITLTDHMREHSEHTQAILENVGEGIITTDEHGIVNSFNTAACNIFGYRPSEVVGMNIKMLLPELHRGRHDQYIADYLKTGMKKAMGRWLENIGIRSNGQQFPIRILVSEIERQGKKIFIGVVRDITERKQAERALLEARDTAQNYLDVASVMLLSLDKHGCITMLNKQGCSITGYQHDELIGKNWFDICALESDRHELQEYYNLVMAGEEPPLNYCQVKLLTKTGSVRTLFIYSSLLRATDGRISGVLYSGEDITEQQRIVKERRQLQQQLTQAQKMEAIGQLTGGIAHDFNNMLAGILGFAELSQDEARQAGNATIVEYLEHVRNSGERARDLVAKMLAFSRQRDSKTAQSVLLSSVIPELLKLLRPVLPTSIEIRTELEYSATPVLLDMVELQQVLMNLCINARDAMNHQGKLLISVRKVAMSEMACSSCHQQIMGDYVDLCVSDTGSGMNKATIEKIFEPFFTTKEVGKGSGMGLSMTHGIVHDRGGHVFVQSEPGKGTEFHLLFPIYAEQAVA